MPQKSIKNFSFGFIAALIMHFFLLNTTAFDFQNHSAKNDAQFAFLGSFLGPLQIKEVNTQNYLSLKMPNIPLTQNKNSSQTSITAPAKPNFSLNIKPHKKLFFKVRPDKTSPERKTPWDIPAESGKNTSLSETYQPLKLP